MDSLLTLHLLDFAPLVQLAAGFYIIFIAIEYTKSFSSLISIHLFNFKGKLDAILDRLRYNKNVLKEFSNRDHYKEGAGKKALEETGMDIDQFNDDIDKVKTIQVVNIDKLCQFGLFRYISIYMFVYCLIVLFVSGLRKNELEWLHSMAVYTLWSYLLSIIIVFLSKWIRNTKQQDGRWIIGTLILTVIGIIGSFLFREVHFGLSNEDVIFYTDWLIIATVVLPYIIFLAYIFLVAICSCQINSACNAAEKELSKKKVKIDSDLHNMRGQVEQEERERLLAETDEEVPEIADQEHESANEEPADE